MCPSSWKLYVDDLPFLGSPPAHLELELELFEVWDYGDDDLSQSHRIKKMRYLMGGHECPTD